MKKAVLIVSIIIIVACFTWYIAEPGKSDRWIGHQSDEISEFQPVSVKPEPSVFVSDKTSDAPSHTPSPTPYAFAETDIPTPPPEPEGWNLVWSDEFDAPLLNMEYWTEIDRRNNYNEELQYYTPSNSNIKNGCLTLTAKEEEIDGRAYTSAMVETQNKLDICYGRVEARISLPVSQGLFPAFWMISKNGHHELDIMEMVGNEPGTIYGVCHYLENRTWKAYGHTKIADPEAFHTYAIEWDKDEVRWYVDDVQYFSTRNNIPDEPMYLVINLAVGGVWPGAPDSTSHFPLIMQVDYVRIYDREDGAWSS